MIVVATDAPLDARQLRRLARRAILGLGRTGSVMAHGSGDYVIAFSNHEANLLPAQESAPRRVVLLPDAWLSPFFQAVAEATEEAIINSLLASPTMRGRDGHVVPGIDPERVRATMRQR
jgi:D-aminopeptidase